MASASILGAITVAGFAFPLIYSVTHWLSFANYALPAWMGWCGVVLVAGGLAIFARAHHDLKTNWSPSLEIYKEHTLVTDDIYSTIRHPMYTSQWLLGLAQALLLQNWLAGALGLLLAVLFYFARVQAEEKMMLDTFGDQYGDYKKKVGGLVPKWPAPWA